MQGGARSTLDVVAEQTNLSAGSDIFVYWREVPVVPEPGPDVPFVESFEVTASASADGSGGVTGEQIFTRIKQLELRGKLIQASLRDIRPKVPITAWATATATGMSDSPTDDYRNMVRVDDKGRSVMFVDLQTWAPGQAEPDCRRGAKCAAEGRCTGREGVCVATSDADCAATTACRSEGACSAGDGACVAASQADCAKSELCKDLKGGEFCDLDKQRCQRVTDLSRFVPASEADCRRSKGCETSGLCGFRGGRCIATIDADCRKSTFCQTFGQCRKKADKCVALSKQD